ncbi:MAG: CPBP family intramembrane metalloprotease [Clostridiales bacterium]|jgi:membrane protease YdiL (CAAX protease family)|nr:CPBP family intramembrane metalloprotease [Clostridiales bacterium]
MDFGYVIRSAILQIVVFSIFPVIWWLIKGRKSDGFFRYFGLTKPHLTDNRAVYAILVYCVIWAVTHLPIFAKYTQPSASAYLGFGISALLPAFIASFFQQGFAEEILFRGFINKRLNSKLGFQFGNIIHALMFAGMHIVFSSDLTLLGGTIAVFTTFIGGYALAYLSERTFDGSIIPGIVLHGLGNFTVCAIQAFS